MKITPVTNHYFSHIQPKNNKIQNRNISNSFDLNSLNYNDYLMFTARVDKSLYRFYSENKDRMPETLKKYIESLDDLSCVEPIDAQFSAFEGLIIAQNVQDVKDYYDDEPLFQNLVPLDEIKSKRGFLYDIRVMKDTLEECSESVLKTGEDFSVYLLKKVFLEAKSLSEINEDLDNDLNPVFQNEQKNYMTYDNFKALGIQLPNAQYLTSLRFTKKGYSDEMGRKIALAYEKLTPEQKAKKSKTSSMFFKKYWQELDDIKKGEISKKRSEAQKARWTKLSPDEKTQLIQKLQTGTDFQKFAMINAWNNCDEIRYALSDFLKEKNIHAAERVIYKTDAYSKYQAQIMSEFWSKNPQYANIIGNAITKSYEQLSQAKNDGSYEKIIEEILQIQKTKKQELKKPQNSKRPAVVESKPKDDKSSEYFEIFKKNYSLAYFFLPQEFVNVYCNHVKNHISNPELMLMWSKLLVNQASEDEINILSTELSSIGESPETFCAKRAAEEAMAQVLYEASDKKAPELFSLQYNPLSIVSYKANKQDSFPFSVALNDDLGNEILITFNKKPDFKKIASLYKKYSKPPYQRTVEELNSLFYSTYVNFIGKSKYSEDTKRALRQFISSYGAAADLILNEKNPEISRQRMLKLSSLLMSTACANL
ncbi:MAG: hypothetical protein IJ877_00730 [Candidatus Gastranaerophilales bacterium]|nr:hypothetical protein [Candidatus Gastranaerophilales bacterium]